MHLLRPMYALCSVCALLVSVSAVQAGTCTVDGDCNDFVACTIDTCDTGTSTCVFTPDDTACDDDAFCNGAETCDALLGCLAGADPCVDGVACTDDTCDEGLDTCSNTANDLNCDDGAFCNGAETCDAVLGCLVGADPCDDGVACTDDTCDEGLDTCSNTANDLNCDDGAFCNGAETCDAVLDCQAGSDPCLPQLCNESSDACVDCLSNADCTRRGTICDTGAGICVECLTVADCDDGVPCTIDACTAGLCSNTPDDTACDDGAFCNGAETCDALLGCLAGADPCDDGVACTDDTCDEALDTCSNSANDLNCDDGAFCNGAETCDAVLGCLAGADPCDDGVACTDDTCDEALDTCSNSANDLNCDDGAFCNGAETCDAVLGCLAGADPCDDGVACTDDTCDEALDTCSNTANNLNCDDGAFCNGAETCDAVLGCLAGTDPCDDAVVCTDDSCDEGLDTCSNNANDGNCDDGAFCNGAETCDAVLGCQSGAGPCDDGVACTDDTCDEALDSCANTPNNGNCNDGVFCNGTEICNATLDCQPGTNPCPGQECNEGLTACVDCLVDADCNDGITCTVDTCDVPSGTCSNTASDPLCDDGAFCNGAETCDAVLDCQAGVSPCDDGVACTDDVCDEALDSCSNTANDANCDDATFCNGTETCDAVLDCLAGSDPCNDGVGCTIDACIEATDSCTNDVSDALCNNGVFCDGVETCDAVLDCQAGADPCDDGVGCTIDTCDEGTTSCGNAPDDASCDDTLFCNGLETCDALGDCQTGADPCPGQFCNDTTDTCFDCLVDADCDDGQFCNGNETCDTGTGSCVAGTLFDCSDGVACTIDTCDEVNDTCVSTPVDGLCDNGQFCDGTETCDAVLDCQPGTPLACDDGIGCTVDTCDETNDVCVQTPNDGACANGQFCDGIEVCDPALDCQPGAALTCDDGVGCTIDTCDETADSCVNTADDSLCDDSQFCNGIETCDAALDCVAGTAIDCDDSVPCTDDTCDEINDVCVSTTNNGLCDDGQFCNGIETCDAAAGCLAGPAVDCNDGVPCTTDSCDETGDACVHTPIAGCQECAVAADCDDGVACTVDTCSAGNCVNTPSNSVCNNGVFCDGDEVCNSVTGCQPGPVRNCNDGIPCTADSCNEAADTCVHAPTNSACNNGQFCDGNETCNPLIGCVAGTPPCNDNVACTENACNEVTNTCIFVPVNANCNNGVFCDGIETCDPIAGCISAGSPCNDGIGCTVDSCNETIDSCTNTPVDGLCDDGDILNGEEFCSPLFDCQEGDPLQLVEIRPIVRQAASGLNSAVGAPPAGATDVESGQPFVVEVWAQLLVDLANPALEGLCCVFADVSFNGNFMSCTSTGSSPEFSNFATGTCGVPGANEVGGCTFNLDVGVVPNWVRIATVTMNADVSNFGNVISLNPATTTISICQFGNVPVDQIVFGVSAPFTIGSPCLYDLDFDTCVTPGDLAFFAPCWLSCDTDTNWTPANCPAADFDCSGCVDPGDLSFFATGWLRCCDDPAIIFPPAPCGVEGGVPLEPAPRDVVEGFGLPYPGDDADPRIKRIPDVKSDGGSKTPSKGTRRISPRLRERHPN